MNEATYSFTNSNYLLLVSRFSEENFENSLFNIFQGEKHDMVKKSTNHRVKWFPMGRVFEVWTTCDSSDISPTRIVMHNRQSHILEAYDNGTFKIKKGSVSEATNTCKL